MRMRPAALAVTVVAALSLAACTGSEEPTPAPEVTASAPVGGTQSGLPQPEEEAFTGEIQTEVIKVGPMDVTVPKGMKLPESTIVTQSEQSAVMMIDEDPQPVIDSIMSSAADAGYEIYAEPSEDQTVFVGHGNAVLFTAIPNAQILTWGPESMKDVLAEG
ncbi:hypothetical protein [Tessaracoccus sp. ZS01]|uniref:hypothetical protein n=1 Tax=Tessaracoccus sp. ZS01 TaxID=1906324 RepID=UPI00096C1ED3|nr:hypothetical protein [Tessaracoccus sp. ZS01]MCG6567508.1 hypothetical protein [Tessaracoccus sp. ZS01]OMG55875.1 hypothetical protein BJN44_07735 [Tessaracoccus sp. ZS01]